MPRVLHITAHMGGGVGKVLSGIAAYAQKSRSQYQHKILMLEPPEKTQFIDLCKDNGVDVLVSSELRHIEEEMREVDIVQLEWWHHPKMAEFLYLFPRIPVKLVIWSHISGCNYPAIPFDFCQAPHLFLFTSKYSLENPYWTTEQKKYARKHTVVINSSGGFEHIPSIERNAHDGFNIGYVGTLNYSKLHPNFVDYCSAINIPDVRFVLVGDNDKQSVIECDAKRKGIIERIEFVGYSKDVHRELSCFDVFGYPLNPDHFGTTENAMLEAMAAGLPVVALNQCAEKHLIQHLHTGLLANNVKEYAELITYLYENPSERIRIGENAREYVLSKLAVKKTVEQLHNNYDSVLKIPSKTFDFTDIFGAVPSKWFLSCLGSERKFFEDSLNLLLMRDEDKALQIESRIRECRPILKEKSKSSVYQFAKYFNNDQNLMYWRGLLNSYYGESNYEV